jgi:hypothetical protein
VANRATAWYGAGMQMRENAQQDRNVRSQARADVAGDLQSIKAQIVQVTNDVRRKMTERYQLEF